MYYLLKLNMNAGLNQQVIIDKLRSSGAETIQTSSGLCIKSQDTADKILSLLGAKTGIDIRPVENSTEDLSEDIRAFISGGGSK